MDDVPLPEFKPRPERLGLGAKYVPHSAALSVQEQALTKKLQGKPSRDDGKGKGKGKPSRRDDGDDDEDEGRSGSVRSKNKRKR